MAKNTNLEWTRPELLAHGMVWAAAMNAIDLVFEAHTEICNDTVAAQCDAAITHFSSLTSVTAAGWCRAYQQVKLALGTVQS